MDRSDSAHAFSELDDKCHAGELSMTVMASEASVQDLSLMRVVPCSTLLSGFARHFSQTGPSPNWQWEMSHCCKNIHVFVSHSWRAPRWQKYLALSMSLNGKAALISGYLACLTALVLQRAEVLPAIGAITSRKTQKPVAFSFWCLLAACLAHFSVLLFWQTFACKFRGAFLDRLCICQTDPQLKTRGIKMLGVFIGNSSSVLVLLDPSYFTRLWCVLEVAAFIHKAGVDWSKSMVFRPLDLTALLVGLCGAGWFALFVWSSGLYFSASLIDSMVMYSAAMLMFTPIWVPASLRYVDAMMLTRETLKNFHIGMAQCSLEEDRVLICNSITTWFGSVHNFEEFIRGECRRAVAQQVGSWNKLSYWYFLFMALPRFAFGCDIMAAKWSTYSESPMSAQVFASRTIFIVASSFLLPAAWFRLFLISVRLTSTMKSLWVRYASIAVVGISLMVGLQAPLMFVKDYGGLYGIVICALLFAILAQANSHFHSAGSQMNLTRNLSLGSVELTVSQTS